MANKYLTTEEIQEILIESKKQKYSNPNVLHFGSKKRSSIFMLSRKPQLILIHGDDHLGYTHIIERHSNISRKAYWNDGNLEKPTKFPLVLPPVDYLNIASKIFDSNNKKESKTEKLDLYEGQLNYKNLNLKCRLLSYKGTGIIHTLYLIDNKQPFNKKKILNLNQGYTSASYDIKNCIQTFKVPYFNSNNIELFRVIIKCFEFENIEKWYIQINNEKGVEKETRLIKETSINNNYLHIQIKIIQFDLYDFSWVEKIIKSIINE